MPKFILTAKGLLKARTIIGGEVYEEPKRDIEGRIKTVMMEKRDRRGVVINSVIFHKGQDFVEVPSDEN